MTIGDLCAAAVSLSDNTAANLLLPLIGGPAGLTAFVRRLGDTVTRFDRTEPTLNTNIDGDEKDTTTPEAMSNLLRMVFTGSVLKPESLTRLKDWMVATSTGNARIRAGVPKGAVVADKTGTGERNATNDVGVIWLPNKAPVFLSIYTSGGTLDADGRNAIIADITKLVFETLGFIETLDKDEASASA
jgi:beta-lactamase class A